MDNKGKTLLERVEPIMSNLEMFRQDVKVKLQHAGNWKNDPDLVMDTVVAEAKEWRKIEAFSQSSTSTSPSRQQDSKSRQRGSKSAGSSAKWEYHRCGQRGHIARNCMVPPPVASGGEQGHSSAARQQRPPHKGNNRGHRLCLCVLLSLIHI